MGLTKSEVRSQKSEVVFETEIYAPLQKLCALKGGVLDPTIFDNNIMPLQTYILKIHLQALYAKLYKSSRERRDVIKPPSPPTSTIK